jgi:putative sigma-54 modulation protein
MWGPVRHGRRAAEGGDCVQVDISTRHGHLSDVSRQKIEAKVMRVTRVFERLTSIHLTVDLEHEEMPSVDLKVSAEHKHDFVSTDRGADLMGSIDAVVHRMESQLRKYKEKIRQRHRSEHDRESHSESVTEKLDSEKE